MARSLHDAVCQGIDAQGQQCGKPIRIADMGRPFCSTTCLENYQRWRQLNPEGQRIKIEGAGRSSRSRKEREN